MVAITFWKSGVCLLSSWSQCSSSFGQSKNYPYNVNRKITKITPTNESQLFDLATRIKILINKVKQCIDTQFRILYSFAKAKSCFTWLCRFLSFHTYTNCKWFSQEIQREILNGCEYLWWRLFVMIYICIICDFAILWAIFAKIFI